MSQTLAQFARQLDPLVELGPPAEEDEVARAEFRLGVRLPAELRDFLLDADGATVAVRLDSGEVIHRASPLVWSLNEVVAENLGPKTDGRPEGVLYFANAGVDGLLFGHTIDASRNVRPEVVVWYPMEDRLVTATASFREYLEGWLGGRLTV
jgi:hypothetical protein